MFNPEQVRRYQPIEYDEMPGDMVTGEAFDLLLALYHSEVNARKSAQNVRPTGVANKLRARWSIPSRKTEISGEPVYPTYDSVRKNIESGMAIGAEHARGIVAQVQSKFDEASKRLLDEFEERYAQINGTKPPPDEEIKGDPV